jgi:hypothetical protein
LGWRLRLQTSEVLRFRARIPGPEGELRSPPESRPLSRRSGCVSAEPYPPIRSVQSTRDEKSQDGKAIYTNCLTHPDALGKLDHSATADAARRVFEERATHAFPPTFVMSPEWRPELEAMARELAFPLVTSAAIEQRFLEVIQMLERSARPDE